MIALRMELPPPLGGGKQVGGVPVSEPSLFSVVLCMYVVLDTLLTHEISQ